MEFLKSNWYLFVFIFAVGGYFTKLQMQVDTLKDKLDKKIFEEYIEDERERKAREDFIDSCKQANDRYQHELELKLEQKYKSTIETKDTQETDKATIK